MGTDNAELADWIYSNLEFDQLILEFYTPGEPNSGWIHCSYTLINLENNFYGLTNQKVKLNTNL
jgi:hypothetical protein